MCCNTVRSFSSSFVMFVIMKLYSHTVWYHRYATQNIELEYRLMPFIPDFIPAVGDIDAFIKVGFWVHCVHCCQDCICHKWMMSNYVTVTARYLWTCCAHCQTDKNCLTGWKSSLWRSRLHLLTFVICYNKIQFSSVHIMSLSDLVSRDDVAWVWNVNVCKWHCVTMTIVLSSQTNVTVQTVQVINVSFSI